MKTFNKSTKLDNVCYDIRGPVMDEAVRMESQGQRILKLNIGNPAPFGFTAPDEVIRDTVKLLMNVPKTNAGINILFSNLASIFSAPSGNTPVFDKITPIPIKRNRYII